MKNMISIAKKFAFASLTVFAMIQCSEEEVKPADAISTPTEAVTTADQSEVTETSFTIAGLHTIFADSVDCSTCTYAVAEDIHLVDGEVLKLAPGSVICLDKALQYKMIEFVNLVGTEENPITIGYCNK